MHVFLIRIWVSFTQPNCGYEFQILALSRENQNRAWRLLRHVWYFLVEQQQQKKSDNATLILLIQYYQDEAKSKENQSIIISTMIKITILSNNSGQTSPSQLTQVSATLLWINTFSSFSTFRQNYQDNQSYNHLLFFWKYLIQKKTMFSCTLFKSLKKVQIL